MSRGFSRGRKSKTYKTVRASYLADFETTTDPDDCRVWAWGQGEVKEDLESHEVVTGTDLDSYLDHINRESAIVYFHNLAFDGSFILDAILRAGYKWVEAFPEPGEFTTLISNMGKFYNIKVVWRNGAATEFRDSLKKLPMSVDRIGKSFGTGFSKLELDYASYRPVGHELTAEEKEYLVADVVIVARALAMQINQGMSKLTVGADSLAEFKRLFGNKVFQRTFPVLTPTMDADIRRAYRGGWTYPDSRFQKQLLGEGSVYDVNSLYPYVMASRLLPYGFPEWFEGAPDPDEEYPLYVVAITFTAKLKKNHVPCIQLRNNIFTGAEYLRTIDEPTTLAVTNVDLELWQRHYDLDILAFNGGWKFKGQVGFFEDYINKWMDVKMNSEGGLREIAKLHLNSLYGKFATNPDVTGKYPILENNIVRLVGGPEESRDPVYTAMGAFITAYAREITIDAAQVNYPRFIYADTDSLHLLGTEPPTGLVVDPVELGAWKREYTFAKALFWRAKAYAEQEPDGKMHVHVAGLPYAVASKVQFKDFVPGKVFGGKLLPQRVPGGIVLTEATYTLK